MSDPKLDDTDRRILYALQEDARRNTNAEISERTGVSASTVGKRIKRLEERGVIEEYRVGIDYEKAGFPLRVLFVCTAPIRDRSEAIEQILEVDGVNNVRELMTGSQNIHVQAVGTSGNDITRIARTIDTQGYTITDEILVRKEYTRPLNTFAE